MAEVEESDYDTLRLRLGVAEGPQEMPEGKCFPLEYNVDYLHGVSFHKGCYIGQELTARQDLSSKETSQSALVYLHR